jgi:threonine/homoserine/homoserine lactone efflux protein
VSPAATLGTVLLAYLPAAITPGPNFVLIAHTAATGTRRAAVAIALGVVAAGGLLAAVAVFGLGGVLARTPWLATALRVACGGYLAWLGARLWWHARAPGGSHGPGGPGAPHDPRRLDAPHPGDPRALGGPGAPDDPDDPGGPGTAHDPGAPGDPDAPGGPGSPSAPGGPDMSRNPGSPGSPGSPGERSAPDTPHDPHGPDTPHDASSPSAPGEPVAPPHQDEVGPTPPNQESAPARRGSAFRRGVVSNLTNPKAAAFFGSVLTAALPPTEPAAVRAAAVALIVAASAGWHLSVALLFSSPATQRWYARAEPALNRVVGTVLVVLGLTLALTP